MEPIAYSKPTVNIELTDSAILQLVKKTEERGFSEIRLGITGGGCNGYEYIFDFNTTNEPSDQIMDFGKFSIHIDNNSRPLLDNLLKLIFLFSRSKLTLFSYFFKISLSSNL